MAVGESQLGGGTDSVSDEEDEVEARVGWRYTVARIRRDTTARWGLYIVTFVLVVAVYALIDSNLSRLTFGQVSDYTFAQLLPIFDHPTHIPPPGEGRQNVPPYFPLADQPWNPLPAGGTLEYPLGTDPAGRDYFTRIVYGTQVSVFVGLASTFIGLSGGTIVGAVAGYYGGRVDDVLMRIVETVYAIPPLILIIVFTVFVGGANIWYAVLGVGIAFVPVFARIIRSRVLSIREMDYIEAAQAAGVKDRNVIMRHVVPNSFAPVLVYATLQIGVTILIVAGLSFLGYGAQPPTPDWGQMLNVAHSNHMHSNIWLSIWPGLAIMITIMGFNLFGDGLQDALDPRIND
ncbi:binding-protein-dependent transport systems inner membrane component [Haloterrigena turkmenica DSM 5511]|uniref:Binding-protein-dependent transport systems inner membrane component n=1 Tax=Haloterrigena turkmenica (strain ATCC 51198 / DSM 5511 / JCM 9101 / NCIMB 13204 / VKM B-1734 / 4k) TaxID=543526 RepID=D2RRT9_HALTV|nr:ABC transporter permease [Haloterrigena turkmenica]ADB62556.1 binding-protein-dependent transport systems inner membrane component [Haloterrigena turkmenica DSM 5511]